MDLSEPVTLVGEGNTVVTLPLVNLLRILITKLMPFMLEYQQVSGKSDISGFSEWLREKLDMKGKNVLL
jgi:hypothetical protein